MKFSAVAVLAAAAGAQAAYSNVTYVTETLTALTTYCPGPTSIVHGGKTYTVTSATTLTITDCPCTVTKPVTTISSVVCHTCYQNSTSPAAPTTVKTTAVGTISSTGAPVKPTSTTITTAGAGKAAALSGAGLAGLLGLAAFVL